MHDFGSIDTNFVKKLYEVIAKHATDTEFQVGQVEKEIGLSRSQLHRKTKAATNHSVSEVVRNYRLKQAAGLIRNSEVTITHVAFEVGFNNLSYFARMFKDYYGKTPSAYALEKSTNPDDVIS